jgi:hypothetical protein
MLKFEKLNSFFCSVGPLFFVKPYIFLSTVHCFHISFRSSKKNVKYILLLFCHLCSNLRFLSSLSVKVSGSTNVRWVFTQNFNVRFVRKVCSLFLVKAFVFHKICSGCGLGSVLHSIQLSILYMMKRLCYGH